MPDVWLRICRRLVPEPWRSSAFDPTVADLHRDWLTRSRRASRGGSLARLRFAAAIGLAALECRRLAARAALTRFAHAPIPEGRLSMFWSTVVRASRVFVRQPSLAIVVVLTMAVGIGANLTIFNFVNQFLLSPLPVPSPEDLVRVSGVTAESRADVVSYPDYRDLRNVSSLDLAAHAQPVTRLGPVDSGEIRTVEVVTGNYFRVMGLTPLRGRLIEDGDNEFEGAHPVVVIGAGYWRSHYDRRESVLGETLLINSTPFEIVGVAPEGFHGTYNAHQVDAWAPLAMQGQVRPRGLSMERRQWGWLSMIGRLRPGATMASAQRDLDASGADLARRFPALSNDSAGPRKFVARPASPMSSSDQQTFRPALGVTFGFTCLLLLVTCANLGGVMQARFVSKRRELAIRRSLGAGRARLMGEWLAEAIVLALAGGLTGLAASRIAAVALSSMKLPVELLGDLTFATRLDWRVVAYATAISIAAGLLFGAITALRAGYVAPMSLLKDEGGAVVSGAAGTRLRRGMVVIQVALSVVLLVAAGLLATSLTNRRTFSPGFDTSHLALVQYDLRRQGVQDADRQVVTDRILERIRQQPGVTHADIGMTVPLAPGQDRMGFSIPGYVSPTGKTTVSIDINVVGPGYFDALGVPFVRGGSWTPLGGSPAVVVNETMAGRFWPGIDPVGKPLKLIGGPDLTIVGVIRDTTYYEIGEAPRAFVFLPAHIQPPNSFITVIRTAGDPAAVLRESTRAVSALDSRLAPSLQLTFDDARGVPLFPMRMLSGAASAFGVIAMLLTAVGLYGVVSTMVGQRTREIGVRMALGARSVTVLSGVIRDALVVAGAGALVGLVAGYWGAGQLRSWLFGVGQFDLGIYLTVAAGVVVLAVLAAAVPARRAAKVDPVVALRN